MRAGTRTELGRKWTPMGYRPVAPVKIGYEFVYLYLTLCPFTGEGFAAFLPKLDGASFSWFVEQMQACLSGSALLIADGAKAHQPAFLAGKAMRLVKLPPACPELNPVERFFQEVRRRLKNRVFVSLQQAEEQVRQAVEELEEKVISLTCFPYIKDTSAQF